MIAAPVIEAQLPPIESLFTPRLARLLLRVVLDAEHEVSDQRERAA